mmetsp:Transcript_24020/g.56781  ORF Transcript_24020/g.56781 Transcript_24020/m.56781 type:complete len:103 (+) Transcript_24020:352-660(+)
MFWSTTTPPSSLSSLLSSVSSSSSSSSLSVNNQCIPVLPSDETSGWKSKYELQPPVRELGLGPFVCGMRLRSWTHTHTHTDNKQKVRIQTTRRRRTRRMTEK